MLQRTKFNEQRQLGAFVHLTQTPSKLNFLPALRVTFFTDWKNKRLGLSLHVNQRDIPQLDKDLRNTLINAHVSENSSSAASASAYYYLTNCAQKIHKNAL